MEKVSVTKHISLCLLSDNYITPSAIKLSGFCIGYSVTVFLCLPWHAFLHTHDTSLLIALLKYWNIIHVQSHVLSLILLQGPVVTDNSNFIIDCQFDKVKSNMPLIANWRCSIKSLLANLCQSWMVRSLTKNGNCFSCRLWFILPWNRYVQVAVWKNTFCTTSTHLCQFAKCILRRNYTLITVKTEEVV